MEIFTRTTSLIGIEGMTKLSRARVAVFGLGGVGGSSAEALARAGVGSLALFDHDVICESNINRQIIATTETVGANKADAMKQRISLINPACDVRANKIFYSAENAESIDLSVYSYILDAIDTVTSKLLLIENAKKAGVPIISCMGTGNKLDATRFEIADIFETSVCPLAKVMRSELKRRNIDKLTVVYSKEPPLKPIYSNASDNSARKQPPGSISFVPPVAGCIMAGEAVRGILNTP